MEAESEYHLIAVEESDSSVGCYNTHSGAEVWRIHVGFWPHEIALSDDGKHAFVSNFGLKDYDETIGTPGFSISLLDLCNGVELNRLYTFSTKEEFLKLRAPHGLKISPDGNSLFVNVETSDNMLVFDIKKNRYLPTKQVLSLLGLELLPIGTVKQPYPIAVDAHNFCFSPGGKYLWIYPSKNGFAKVIATTGEQVGEFNLAGRGVIRGIDYTADLQCLVVSASNTLYLVNPETLEVVRKSEPLEVRQLLYSVGTPDGQYILSPAVWEGQILVFDAKSLKLIKKIQVGLDPIHIVITPDSRFAFISHGRSYFILRIDLTTLLCAGYIQTHGGSNGITLTHAMMRKPKDTLIFGAAIPLSGGSSREGRELYLGYQFWQEQINSAGGLSINGKVYEVALAIRDTASSVDEAAIREITKAILNEDRAHFLFGTYPSPPNEYAASVAELASIPMVTASGAANRIYEQGFRHLFGIMSPANGFLRETLNWLTKVEPKPQTIIICACEDPAALGDARTTAQIAANLGFTILSPDVGFSIDVSGVLIFKHLNESFAAFIDAAKLAKVDLVIQTGHLTESIALVKEAHQQRFTPKGFVFSVGPALWGFVDELGPLSENMIGAAMWTSMQDSCGTDPFVTPNEFAKAFMARYSAKASYLSAGAYACGLMYQKCFEQAQTIDGSLVAEQMRKMECDLFYSHVKFNENGLNVNRPVVTIQLQKRGNDIVHAPIWPASLSGGEKARWPFPGWSI